MHPALATRLGAALPKHAVVNYMENGVQETFSW
jgi:hypothetical protein